MHIVVDVAGDRLKAEVVDYLVRAGHTVERGAAGACPHFDLALVGTAEAAARLRAARPHAAIIVVTKLGDVTARVQALDSGADDAFDSGFPMSQVAARVGAAGRRAAAIPRPPELVEIDGCTIDLTASTATRGGDAIALTTREVEIVRYLARHAGRVVSRGELLQNVWRVAAGSETRAVDVAMVGLRGKLEREPGKPAIIVSVRGAGYRWG